MKNKEIWKTLEQYPEFKFSSFGRIIRPNGNFATQSLSKRGYKVCGVKSYVIPVHRLIAIAFHGPPPIGKHLVNHKDLDKLNNYADNLEWSDHRYNNCHSYMNGAHKKNGIIIDKVIANIMIDAINNGFTRLNVSRYFKCDPETVSKVYNRTHFIFTQ